MYGNKYLISFLFPPGHFKKGRLFVELLVLAILFLSNIIVHQQQQKKFYRVRPAAQAYRKNML